jgi:hypothetical protein
MSRTWPCEGCGRPTTVFYGLLDRWGQPHPLYPPRCRACFDEMAAARAPTPDEIAQARAVRLKEQQ